jgi:hypothetical protein
VAVTYDSDDENIIMNTTSEIADAAKDMTTDSCSGSGDASAAGQSFDGASRMTTGSGTADEQDKVYFAVRESTDVRRIKTFMFLILFLVTVTVCLTVYFIVASLEQDEFDAS